MQIHILMFEDRIEKASMDGRKMQELADEMNGGPPGFEIFGPYDVVSVELEDAVLTTDAADAKGRCTCIIASQSCGHYQGDGMCGA